MSWGAVLCVGLPGSVRAEIEVKPAGMRVVWHSFGKEFDGFKTYNADAGISATLVLLSDDKNIIAFDKDGSKIQLLDKDMELGADFGFWNKTSKDGKAIRIEVDASKLPASGASEVRLKGDLKLVLASEKKTHASQVQAFKKGDKLELAKGFKFTVGKLGKPKWGDAELEVTLSWRRTVPELAEVRFYDADGKLIKSSPNGGSSSNFAGIVNINKDYSLDRKVDSFRIEIDLWEDAEKVVLPVDLKLSIGKP